MKKTSQKAKEINKILDIRKLTFIADKTIIDSIDWQVNEGERWVLLGANGAGKTSLISTICAYNTPSSGTMTVDGKTYSDYDWQKVREKIALVGSQLKRNIERDETVLEVVISGKFAMINYWGRISKELAAEAMRKLKYLHIGTLANNRWGYISQGERQKVMLARALMVKPTVIFLDEPCTGLDPAARKNFVEFLDELATDRRNKAIIMATHYVEEIPPSFTHAIIIKNGKVLASGKISEVMTSSNLSEAYGQKCTLRKSRGHYRLEI